MARSKRQILIWSYQIIVTVTAIKMISPFDLPSGVLLLVTDQLSSPADFVLHRSLIEHLKGATKSDTTRPKKALVLSVSEDLARWKAIAAKSVCLPQAYHGVP
jgi:hypothetical protein